MSNPPEAASYSNSTKLLILLPLRAIYFYWLHYETPCINKSKLSVFFRHVLFRHRYKLCIYLGPCKGIVARFTISLQLFVEECCWWFGVYKVNTYLLKVRSPCIIQCVPLFFARQSFRYLSADFQANLSNEHFIKQRSSNSLF